MAYHENHAGYDTARYGGYDVSSIAGGLDGRGYDGTQPSGLVDQTSQQNQQQQQSYNLIPQSLSEQPVRFKFPFPSIQHKLYPEPIKLKAHSSFDLSETDPEIFAILQSVMTTYLQTLMGKSLQAYTLEVDYSPGHDDEVVAEGVIVTNLQVSCTLKVVSETLDSLTMVNHKQVRQWIRDMFVGTELSTLLSQLRKNNINVNEIVFAEDEFRLANGGPVVAGINGEASSSSSSTSGEGGKSGNAGAMIGVTLGVIVVGVILFLHLTGRLPSKERLSSIRDSLGSRGGSRSDRSDRSKSTNPFLDEEDELNGKQDGYGLGRRLWSAMFGRSDDGLNDDFARDGDEEGGKRRRTFSGTFRRFPTGGIRPAAIQKHPAHSKDYIKDAYANDTSKSSIALSSSSSDGGDDRARVGRTRKSNSSSAASNAVGDEDISFSYHDSVMGTDYDIDGDDYGPRSPSHRTTSSSNGHRPFRHHHHQHEQQQQKRGDEFSMPDDYDTVTEDQPSVYSKWSQSVMTRSSFFPRNGLWSSSSPQRSNNVPRSPGGSTSPLVSSTSPRRVTPADIASPNDYSRGGPQAQHNTILDEWSVGSYDTRSPSARHHHHHQQQQRPRHNQQPYRDWVDNSTTTPSPPSRNNNNNKDGLMKGSSTNNEKETPVDNSRFKLSIPRFA